MPGTVLGQRKSLPGRRYLATIICLVTIGLGFLGQGTPVGAEQQQADADLVIRIAPAIQEVVPGDAFVIDVTIESVTDLGGFQFDLLYDPTIVTVVDVVLGPFTGSTGRTTNLLGPKMEMKGSAGIVSFGAFTFDSQPGPQGDGVLATVTLTAVGSGASALQLQHVQVTDTTGNVQLASVEGSSVVVIAPTPESTSTPIPTLTSTPSPAPTSIATATQTTIPATTTTSMNTPPATATDMATATLSATTTVVGRAVAPAATVAPTITVPTTTTSADMRSPTPGAAAFQSPSTAAAQVAAGPTAIPIAVARQPKPSSVPLSNLAPILMNCLSLLGCLVFGGLLTLIVGCGFTSLFSRYKDRR